MAARAGADAIGIICYPAAARYVPPEVARTIVAAVPPFVMTVALFVDADPADIASVQAATRVSCVQLHGHESPDLVRQVRGPVLKAVRVERGTIHATLDHWRNEIRSGGLEHLAGLLLETAGPGVGGTGVANDWDLIAELSTAGVFEGLPPVIAAGGLTPIDVTDVVTRCRPWAVDVSSGVERVKGEKSPDLVRAFVSAVRRGDASRRD